MLVSGIMDLSGSDNETLSLVLKLVAVLFLCGALGAGFALNKKLQQSQHGQPFSQQQMPPFPPQQQFPLQQPFSSQQQPPVPPHQPQQFPAPPQRPQQGPPTRGQ